MADRASRPDAAPVPLTEVSPSAPVARTPDKQDVLSALGELEVAHEELRVAEDELARNRVQLQEMISQYESGQRWREHLFALLPVGVLVTDDMGTVLEANGAASAMLGIRPALLTRKPLPVYVDAPQRRLVREMIAQLARGEAELRATVVLRARGGEARCAALIALRDPATTPTAIRWLLMPRDDALPPVAAARLVETDDDELRAATAIAQLCTLPVEADDQQRLLGQMALVARSAVRSATTVSVTIGDPLAPDRTATDSTEAQRLDGMQLQAGEGPSVDAYHGGGAVVVTDLLTDARWPRLATVSRTQSLHSVLALPIRLAEERAGVLSLYGAPGIFAERTVRIGEIVASAVAAVLRGVNERSSLMALVHHLERALNSRAVIEQAKGIVMAHHGGTPDEAFARLVTFSTRNNVKLRDLATLIVEGGAGQLRGL